MPFSADRLPRFTESVIREMTRIAYQYGAINLSQGYPDFDPPIELIHAAEQALRSGHNQYSITWGSPRLRSALAEKQRRFMGIDIHPEQHITVTCGCTEAMLAALFSVCNPGDRVIIFTPYYENYIPDTILTGASPVFVPLNLPDFTFDADELRQAFQAGVRAIILCNPANPSGKVFSRDELLVIAQLAQEYDAWVITDEVYEHIVYPPYTHTYIASLPGMFERTISCGSLSKTYAVTGWRLGYAIAPESVSTDIRKVHDFLTVGAPSPLQEAAVTALLFPDTYYQELLAAYIRRRDIFLGYLEQANIHFTHPQGAYYVLIDISDYAFPDDTRFCIWLAQEIGVAAVPGSSFFDLPSSSLVRLNFAKQEQTLHLAGERLLRLPEKI
jgi:aminotransferase